MTSAITINYIIVCFVCYHSHVHMIITKVKPPRRVDTPAEKRLIRIRNHCCHGDHLCYLVASARLACRETTHKNPKPLMPWRSPVLYSRFGEAHLPRNDSLPMGPVSTHMFACRFGEAQNSLPAEKRLILEVVPPEVIDHPHTIMPFQ